MQSEVKLLLLRLVKSNGNISPLIKMGYEYAQVASFLEILIHEEKLNKQGNKILITKSGLEDIETLNKKLNRSNSTLWIEPAYQNKIPKFDSNDIFLPDQNELSF